MKKLLFVFVLFMLVANLGTGVARDIPFKAAHDDSGGNIMRSATKQPAHASINEGLLSIDFDTISDNVTIIITNKDTGKTVYSNSFSTILNMSLDLNNEEAGTYLLELRIDKSIFVGEFLL